MLYPETKGCALEDMDALFSKYIGEGLTGRLVVESDPGRGPDEGRSAERRSLGADTGESQPLLAR